MAPLSTNTNNEHDSPYNKRKTMSQQTTKINLMSSKTPQWRVSSSQRNISNPYNLAIPPQYQRRLQTSSPVRDAAKKRPALPTINSSDAPPVKPKRPVKAVLVGEKPRGMYTNSSKSKSTIFTYRQVSPYQAPRKKTLRLPSIDDRFLALIVTLTLALLLTIGIPLAAILPQKLIKPLPINILIPMYFKPEDGAWNRLHDAAIRYPKTTFNVIINPNNGSGMAAWPAGEYIDAIESLDKYTNIHTLGYIDTANGQKENATIRQEIALYAGWAKVSNSLSLSGIYFDHTPHKDQDATRAYLQNISATVRHADGFGAQTLVVQNPGQVPDEGLMMGVDRPNVTVVFEGAYADVPNRGALHEMLAPLNANATRENFALLVHSAPDGLGGTGLRKMIDGVRREVEWLYVTDLTDEDSGPYSGFGGLLETWLNSAAPSAGKDTYIRLINFLTSLSAMSPKSRSSILLPLYIYPCPNAWEPLYTAIAKHPHLQFLAIINPNSGPGAAPWWPNEDYIREIARLNALPNVKTLGYICATYCKRSLDAALDDIDIYGERGRKDAHQRVDGVFVDETVNLYSDEAKKWLDAVDRKVAHSLDYVENPITIHNPGTAVHAALGKPGPDITVVVETSFKHFMTKEYQKWLATSPYGRSRTAYMVHSVPEKEMKKLTLSLREKAGYLFVTSASSGFYESFGSSWAAFVDTMAKP
ncbi:cell surface [Pyrenophora seminiperda CCB06]|uniref:Cell surface n=1 Tax=Pyrenophora seminiperda CCB06 TaxID=1302712 RepID=A0A3M7M896_9PLEO|nr:cell surface [Pyrenophora seminiperda CCB06]